MVFAQRGENTQHSPEVTILSVFNVDTAWLSPDEGRPLPSE